MQFDIHQEGEFKYVEVGNGDKILLLLHGLFGALSNFEDLVNHFQGEYKVAVPLLPIFELPAREVSLDALADYVKRFVEYKGYERVNVLGNSLGGHIALIYILAYPEQVNSLILTGSSGLFESAMGSTYPKRGDYEYIKNKTEYTFYDPKLATKELVDEVFDIVNDRAKAVNVIATAKSAIRHNLETKLKDITAPTLLIWGAQDNITPPFVGEEFKQGIPNAELHFVDQCGHAPMMERPDAFNPILEAFLKRVS